MSRDPYAQTTIYEWVVEDVDEAGDILECSYWPERQLQDALADAKARREGGALVDFGLCRRQGTDAEGDTDRQYAYRDDVAGWPDRFEYGARIPERLRRVLP